jgi:hypothetical protein
MRRTPIIVALTATLAILAIPQIASAVEIHQKTYVGEDLPGLPREVERIIHVAPRDSDDDGVANREDDCPKVAAPGGCPPEPPIDASSVSTAAPATTSYAPAPTSSGGCGGTTPYAGGGSCWAIPYEIVACESGGDYGAYNPSGASGAYQLMPEHGCGTSAAEQDACAAELWAGGAGRSNWVC